jgi:hypothetical protein
VKKEQNGRKSLRRLKPTVGCNASKRRIYYLILCKQCSVPGVKSVTANGSKDDKAIRTRL